MAAEACQLQDPSTALGSQVRQRRPDHGNRAQHVGVQLSPDLLVGHLLVGAEQAIAGIGDDDVDTPQLLPRIVDHSTDPVCVGDVEREGAQLIAVALSEVAEAVGVAQRGSNAVTPL